MADAKLRPRRSHLHPFLRQLRQLRQLRLALTLLAGLAMLAAGEARAEGGASAAAGRPAPQAAAQQPQDDILIWTIYHRDDLSPNSTFNVLFVADKEFGDLNDTGTRARFRAALNPLIDKGLGYNAALALNIDFFSLWYTTLPAEVTFGDSVCPRINLPKDIFKIARSQEKVLVPDLIVVLHTKPGGHCAWPGAVRTVSIGMPQLTVGALSPQAPRILVHEMGHTLGLPDEYTAADSYHAAPPVLYDSQAACQNDPANSAWRQDQPCQELLTADESAAFWRSEQFPNIMSAGGEQVIEFGPSNWVVLKRFFSEQRRAVLIVHDPPVFSPHNWDPLAAPTATPSP